MPGSLRLGKIAGMDIYAHLSWCFIMVLLTWSLASGCFSQLLPGWSRTSYGIVAFMPAMFLVGCAVVNELAHALVAQASGLTVRNITLFIFGGVAHVEEDMKRPGVEFRVAIAGPIASFLLAGVAFLLVLPLRGSGASAEAALDYLAVANFLLGAFNLLPGFPLDGGRVLRSIIWKVTGNFKKSTHIASSVGQAFAYVFILLGIIGFFTGNFFNGLWVVFIGWFLLSAAKTASTQGGLQSALQGVSVGQVMGARPLVVRAK